MVFYNEAAAALLGRSFEEAGRMEAEQWTQAFGPFDDGGAAGRGRRAGDHGGDPRGPPRARDLRRSGPRAAASSAIEASAFPIVASEHGSSGAMVLFWPTRGRERSRRMKLKVWGARGSVPAPGPQMNRYGGNTSCVQVTLGRAARS